MSYLLEGGCTCGAIRYVCSAEPTMSFNCHCIDCQRITGGAFLAGVVVPSSAFSFTRGKPKYHAYKSESGNHKHYGFCSECGNPIDAVIDEHPDIWVIASGSFDEPSQFRPTTVFFSASAQSWMHLDPAIEKFATEPPTN